MKLFVSVGVDDMPQFFFFFFFPILKIEIQQELLFLTFLSPLIKFLLVANKLINIIFSHLLAWRSCLWSSSGCARLGFGLLASHGKSSLSRVLCSARETQERVRGMVGEDIWKTNRNSSLIS